MVPGAAASWPVIPVVGGWAVVLPFRDPTLPAALNGDGGVTDLQGSNKSEG